MMIPFPNDGTSAIVDSGVPGPVFVVLGGVHGDERCGINVVNAIITGAFAPPLSVGKLVAVLANPFAVAHGKRFVRHNMNRAFLPSVTCGCEECFRAKQVALLLDQADVLLDIHASYTPASEPFLICENNARAYAEAMPVEKVCFGFDEVQPGGTDYHMNARGKVGMCLECGYLDDPRSTEVAFGGLTALLSAMNERPSAAVRSKRYFRASSQYISRENFVLRSPLADFEYVKAGQVLGMDGDREVCAPSDGAVLFATNRNRAREESFVFLDML